MRKKVAIILTGCGYLDGSEVNESVLILTILQMYKIEYEIFSIDNTFNTVNHSDNVPTDEKRNILVETSRITRKTALDINKLLVENYDALIIPGGYGVIKYFTNYFAKNTQITFHYNIDKIIKMFYKENKIICGICIAPLLISLVLSSSVYDNKITVTIGQDSDNMIENAGGVNITLSSTEYYYDLNNNILSCPAYMSSENRAEIFIGMEKMIKKLSQLI